MRVDQPLSIEIPSNHRSGHINGIHCLFFENDSDYLNLATPVVSFYITNNLHVRISNLPVDFKHELLSSFRQVFNFFNVSEENRDYAGYDTESHSEVDFKGRRDMTFIDISTAFQIPLPHPFEITQGSVSIQIRGIRQSYLNSVTYVPITEVSGFQINVDPHLPVVVSPTAEVISVSSSPSLVTDVEEISLPEDEFVEIEQLLMEQESQTRPMHDALNAEYYWQLPLQSDRVTDYYGKNGLYICPSCLTLSKTYDEFINQHYRARAFTQTARKNEIYKNG